MSQPKKPEKPDPIEDVREGLGLLFRAAKNAVKELPTDKLEETLKTGVREVAHAVESVAGAIEREVFGAKKSEGESTGAKSEGAAAPPAASDDAEKDADKVRVAADGVTTSGAATPEGTRGDQPAPAPPPPDSPPKT